MNKDLYIALLEEHVDDLTTAAKIDTVLTERKTIRIRNLEAQLLSLRDCNKAQDELISKLADTTMDCQDDFNELNNLCLNLAKDLNDFAADWATDHAEYRKTLETIKERNTRANDEIVLLRSKGTEIDKELKREVFQLNKQNDDLHKQLNEAVREIAKLHGDKSAKEENK